MSTRVTITLGALSFQPRNNKLPKKFGKWPKPNPLPFYVHNAHAIVLF